jgi:hypothetical protein
MSKRRDLIGVGDGREIPVCAEVFPKNGVVRLADLAVLRKTVMSSPLSPRYSAA